MKCFIVTKGDPLRLRVQKVVDFYTLDPTYCCDTKKQRASLMNVGIPKSQIVITDVGKKSGIQGVSRARDFVCREVMEKGEWSLWIDDNVEMITGLKHKLSKPKLDFSDASVDWREEFDKAVSRKDFYRYLKESIARAEDVGSIFCGFATGNNYFFRANKWQDFGYCRTQLALYKNDGSSWFPFESMMLEDMYKSIDVVCRYGQVVINRHMKPVKPQFESGGIGSFKKRLPHLKDNCKRLMELYPGLLKYQGNGKQYGMKDETHFHVTFAKISPNTVNQWRKENGYA